MEMFVGAKAVTFSAESAIMVEANAALEGCLFAMELGLVCGQHQWQHPKGTMVSGNEAADRLAAVALSRLSPEV
ncbi:unnamed protein product [Prunus armeniaca]